MTDGFDRVLDLMTLDQSSDTEFLGHQLDGPNHHIIGSVVACQALVAASKTACGRLPHSEHMYFLRRGDARYPVHYGVSLLRDGGTLSTRRVTVSQGDVVLAEVIASFSSESHGADYQQKMPDGPGPDGLVSLSQLMSGATELSAPPPWPLGFDMRYVNGPPVTQGPDVQQRPRIQLWLRCEGVVPNDPVLQRALLAYISGLTLLQGAATVMGPTPAQPRMSALIDHAIWFHRAADFSDWLFYDQHTTSVTAARGLSTGAIYNRSGELVCSAIQEGYFPAGRATGTE
jgi:acyl-CoA thioesterase-2